MSIEDNVLAHTLELEEIWAQKRIKIPGKYHVHAPLQIGSAFVFCVTNYESQIVFTSSETISYVVPCNWTWTTRYMIKMKKRSSDQMLLNYEKENSHTFSSAVNKNSSIR